MKNNLIRAMAIAILATSISGFAQGSFDEKNGDTQTTSEKKSKKTSDSKKKSDSKKTNDQMKDNDQLFQIYG